MFETNVLGKIKTHFTLNDFSPKIMPILR